MRAGFLALALVFPAHAEDWVELPTTTSWYRFAYDRDSIVRQGTTVRFWDRTVYLRSVEADAVSGLPIAEKRVRRIARCDESGAGILEGRVYGTDGRLLESITNREWTVDLVPVNSQSLAATLIRAVCAEPVGKQPR